MTGKYTLQDFEKELKKHFPDKEFECRDASMLPAVVYNGKCGPLSASRVEFESSEIPDEPAPRWSVKHRSNWNATHYGPSLLVAYSKFIETKEERT